jgi:uncharacterized protein
MQELRAKLRAIIKREMEQDPAHDIAHLDRVWANAHRIARSETGVNLKKRRRFCRILGFQLRISQRRSM